jgi:condensin complex subunit 3
MMGLVSQLISPAMRSKDEAVREQGFLCMGLCSILDADVAATTFPMFLNHLQRSSGIIKVRALQVTFDMLTVHGISRLSAAQVEGLGGGPEAEAKAHEHLVTFLLSLLEDEDEELRVQSAAAQGMAKLMLAGIVEDDVALRSLVLIYMTPETAGNQELRQCLGYFLPVYCFSSPHNQRKLQRVSPEEQRCELVADTCTPGLRRDAAHPRRAVLRAGGRAGDGHAAAGRPAAARLDRPEQVYVSGPHLPPQICSADATARRSRQDGDQTIHVDVAMDLMKQLLLLDDKDERKVLCQLLAKLNLPEPEALSADRAEALFLLARVLKAVRPTASAHVCSI